MGARVSLPRYHVWADVRKFRSGPLLLSAHLVARPICGQAIYGSVTAEPLVTYCYDLK